MASSSSGPVRFGNRQTQRRNSASRRSGQSVRRRAWSIRGSTAVSVVRHSIHYLNAYGYVQLPAFVDAGPIQSISTVVATLSARIRSAPNGPAGAERRGASRASRDYSLHSKARGRHGRLFTIAPTTPCPSSHRQALSTFSRATGVGIVGVGSALSRRRLNAR
jgi:hypothetical protein